MTTPAKTYGAGSECIVCCDNIANVAVLPCKHFLCNTCVANPRLGLTSVAIFNDTARCPSCRDLVQGFQKLDAATLQALQAAENGTGDASSLRSATSSRPVSTPGFSSPVSQLHTQPQSSRGTEQTYRTPPSFTANTGMPYMLNSAGSARGFGDASRGGRGGRGVRGGASAYNAALRGGLGGAPTYNAPAYNASYRGGGGGSPLVGGAGGTTPSTYHAPVQHDDVLRRTYPTFNDVLHGHHPSFIINDLFGGSRGGASHPAQHAPLRGGGAGSLQVPHPIRGGPAAYNASPRGGGAGGTTPSTYHAPVQHDDVLRRTYPTFNDVLHGHHPSLIINDLFGGSRGGASHPTQHVPLRGGPPLVGGRGGAASHLYNDSVSGGRGRDQYLFTYNDPTPGGSATTASNSSARIGRGRTQFLLTYNDPMSGGPVRGGRGGLGRGGRGGYR